MSCYYIMINTVDMETTLDNSVIEDKVTKFEKKFIQFKIELKLFETLKSGYKIMKNNYTNVLYYEPPSNWQWVKRWWYGEDKERTFEYLHILFTQFMKFLDSILKYMRAFDNCPRIIRLNVQICKYINLIIPGLCSLKYTYPDYKEIHCKVASIVITLIDFKKETYRNGRKNQRNSRIPSYEI